MEDIDTINKIIEAEQVAQAIVREANNQMDRLPEMMAEENRKLFEAYRLRAEEEIREFRAKEEAQRDGQLDGLQRQLADELAALDDQAEKMLETWISDLFARVTLQDVSTDQV